MVLNISDYSLQQPLKIIMYCLTLHHQPSDRSMHRWRHLDLGSRVRGGGDILVTQVINKLFGPCFDSVSYRVRLLKTNNCKHENILRAVY